MKYIIPLLLIFIASCKKDDKSIGDNYGGGIVIFVSSDGHGLVVAPEDQSAGVGWGCNNVNVSGAMSTDFGSGPENTKAIVSECSQSVYAAKICDDLVLNGFDDWYLPSRDELAQLYALKDIVPSLTSDANYWSSSQFDAQKAWYVYFNSGVQRETLKTHTDLHVRAVRKF